MNDTAKIHIVKAGESLTEIAGHYEMSADEIVTFHNFHCQALGLRWFQNFVGMDRIAVPARFKSKEQQKNEHLRNFPPRVFSRDFYAERFKVSEFFSTPEKEFEISYYLTLRFSKKENQNVVYISAGEFKKDGNDADDKMSSVAIASMKTAEPFGFYLDEDGKLSALESPEIYHKRFSDGRSDLDEFFVGEIFEAYLNKFGESLRNPEYVFRQFLQRFPYQLLFPGMQVFHWHKPWQDSKVLADNSFPVRMDFEAVYQHEDTEFAETDISGRIAEDISLLEILRGVRFGEEPEEIANISYSINYKTEKEEKKLVSAEMKIEMKFEEEPYSSYRCTLSV